MGVLVRRPKAIVFDILGTASKSGFLEKVLFPFLKLNLDGYISSHWTKKEFKVLYNKILQQSIDFHKQEPSTPLVLAYEIPNSRTSLMNFINFVTDNGVNASAVTHLRFKVWFEGYQQNKLRTPIYSDVPNQMRKWFAEGVKFYVFSNTWVDAQKALLRNTNHGDLTNLISGHYDNEFGNLNESDSWRRLCNEIREKAENVLFLTKSSIEARAAADAGLAVVLVLTHRHNVKGVSHEDRTRFPYVRTLNDLAWLEEGQGSNVGPTSGGAGAGAAEVTVQSQVPTAISGTGTGTQPPVGSSTNTSVSGASRSTSAKNNASTVTGGTSQATSSTSSHK